MSEDNNYAINISDEEPLKRIISPDITIREITREAVETRRDISITAYASGDVEVSIDVP